MKSDSELKFSWRKYLTKKSSLLQLITPHRRSVVALLRCEECAVTKKVYSYNTIVPIVTITTKECTLRTGSVTNYYENYFSNMLQA